MSTLYDGDFTQTSAAGGWTPIAISSSTNATPIVITTAVNHGYATGDSVQVYAHKVNTAANGQFTGTVLTANTLALNGSTGNGVGAATGYIVNYAVRPKWQLISDGDVLNASNLNPAPEAAANALPFLYKRSGKFSLVDIYIGEAAAGPTLTPYSTTTPAATTWTNLTSMTGLLSFGSVAPAILPSDWLEIEFQTSINLGGTIGGGPWAVGLAYELNGGAYTLLTQSIVGVAQTAGPVGLSLRWTGNGLALAAGGDLFNLAVQGWAANNTTNFVLFNSYIVTAKHFRLNS